MGQRLQSGDVLEGKYRILRQLGEGGMGVVYEGEHRELEKRVAVKVLHPIEADDPTMRARFRTEAKSAASIRHPNVVEVYDYGLTPDGRPFFVMEYLEGESLGDLLDRVRILKPARAVEITDQVLRGLCAAHHRGIIHRDLKPENIFLARIEDGSKVVKILDFGIAKIAGDRGTTQAHQDPSHTRRRSTQRFLTQQGVVMGTPGYMAPETLTGQGTIDARVDLFAVGVLLFEMLCGRQPFRGDSAHDIMVATATKPVPKLRDINPHISEAMEQLCLIALAKNPDTRFQTAEEFLDYLTAAAVGKIPDYGRACHTDTAVPSLIPAPIDDTSDTSTLELAPVTAPAAARRSLTRNRTTAAGPSRRQPRGLEDLRPGTGPGRPYVGPPRRKRVYVSISFGSVLIFLSVVGAAAYLVWNSALFRGAVTANPLRPVPLEHAFESTPDTGGAVAAPPLPSRVTIWVDVEPKDAQVFWNGHRKEQWPFRVDRSDRPVRVEVRRKGYRTAHVTLVPDGDKTLSVVLEPAAKRPGKASRTRR